MRPGQLLMSRTIDRAVQLGCIEYDFLRGAEAYKQMWASAVRHTVTITIYGNGWRARLAQAAHWLRRQAGKQKRRMATPAVAAPENQ
jgi:CelD/BcsL family acetyltransferase involved in cellulose biosynthesis